MFQYQFNPAWNHGIYHGGCDPYFDNRWQAPYSDAPVAPSTIGAPYDYGYAAQQAHGYHQNSYPPYCGAPVQDYNHNVLPGGQDAHPRKDWCPPVPGNEPLPSFEERKEQEAEIRRSPPFSDPPAKKRSSSPPPRRRSRSPPLRQRNRLRTPSPTYRRRSPPPLMGLRIRRRTPPWGRRRSPPPPRFEAPRYRPRTPPPRFRSRSPRPRGRSPRRRLSRSPPMSRAPRYPQRSRWDAERETLQSSCSYSNRFSADERLKEMSMNAIARYRSRSKSPIGTRSWKKVKNDKSARGHVSSKEKIEENSSKSALDKHFKKSEKDENVVPSEAASQNRPNICSPKIRQEKCETETVNLKSTAAAHTASHQAPPQASVTNHCDPGEKEAVLNSTTHSSPCGKIEDTTVPAEPTPGGASSALLDAAHRKHKRKCDSACVVKDSRGTQEKCETQSVQMKSTAAASHQAPPQASVTNQIDPSEKEAVLNRTAHSKHGAIVSAEPAPGGASCAVLDPAHRKPEKKRDSACVVKDPRGTQEKCETQSAHMKSTATARTTYQAPPQASATNHIEPSEKEAILNRTTHSRPCGKIQDSAVVPAEPDPAHRKHERKHDSVGVDKDACPRQEKHKTEFVNLKSSAAVHTTVKKSSSKVSVQASSKSELPVQRRNSEDSDKQNFTALEKNPSGSPLYQPSFNKSFKIPKKGNTSPATGTASSNMLSENVKVPLHQSKAKHSERLPNPLLEPQSVSQPVIQSPQTWLQCSPTPRVKKILLTKSPGRNVEWQINEKKNEDVIATLEGWQEINLSKEVEITRKRSKEEEKRRQIAELEEATKNKRHKEEDKLKNLKEDKRKQELKQEESKNKKRSKDEKQSKKVKEQKDKKEVYEAKTNQETSAEKKRRRSSTSKTKKNEAKIDETRKGSHKISKDVEGLKTKKEEEVNKKKSKSKSEKHEKPRSKESKEKEVKSKQDENKKRKREERKKDVNKKKCKTKREESPEWTPNRRSSTPSRQSSTPGRQSSTPGRQSRTPRRCKTPDSTTPFVPSGVASRTRSRTGSPSARKSVSYSNCFSDSAEEIDEPFNGWDSQSINNWILNTEDTIVVSLTQENYVSIENWHLESPPMKSAALTAIAQSYTPASPTPSTCSTPPLPALHSSLDSASTLRMETETTPRVSTNVPNEINSSSTVSIPSDVVQANVVSSCSTPTQDTLPTFNTSGVGHPSESRQNAKEIEVIDITEEVEEIHLCIKKHCFKDAWNALRPLVRQKFEKLTDAYQLARSSIDNFIKNYREREKVRNYQFRATELKKLKIDFVKNFHEYFERSKDLKAELTLDFNEEEIFFLLDEKVIRDYGRKGDSKDTLVEMEYLHCVTTGQKNIMDEPPEKKPTSHAFIAAGILTMKPLYQDEDHDKEHTLHPVAVSLPLRSVAGITRLPTTPGSHEYTGHAQSNLKVEESNEPINGQLTSISKNSHNSIQEDVLDLSQRTLDRTVGSSEPADNNQQPESEQEDGVRVTCICCPDRARMMCSGCYATWYCSSECQANHWEGGHKMNCQEARQ